MSLIIFNTDQRARLAQQLDAGAARKHLLAELPRLKLAELAGPDNCPPFTDMDLVAMKKYDDTHGQAVANPSPGYAERWRVIVKMIDYAKWRKLL